MAHSARATLSVLPACAVEATAAAIKAVALGAPTAVIVASAAHAPAVTHSSVANALVRVEYMTWAIWFGRGVNLSHLTPCMSGSDR